MIKNFTILIWKEYGDYHVVKEDCERTLRGTKAYASRELKKYALRMGKGNYKVTIFKGPDLKVVCSYKRYFYSGLGWLVEDPNWKDTQIGRHQKFCDMRQTRKINTETRKEESCQ